jgi:hypothetical protein
LPRQGFKNLGMERIDNVGISRREIKIEIEWKSFLDPWRSSQTRPRKPIPPAQQQAKVMAVVRRDTPRIYAGSARQNGVRRQGFPPAAP